MTEFVPDSALGDYYWLLLTLLIDPNDLKYSTGVVSLWGGYFRVMLGGNGNSRFNEGVGQVQGWMYITRSPKLTDAC